ncbi:hypothetical protein COOONC_18196 [Cooperia oncophora]
MYPAITCQVIGDEFLTDPCRLDHDCRPEKYVRERGDRAVYEELQHVREDSKYTAIKPVQVFFDLVAQRREADNGSLSVIFRSREWGTPSEQTFVDRATILESQQ